jgi:copper(I)-binding protein
MRVTAIAWLAAASPALAGPPATIRIDHAWARATAPHQDSTAIYLTMRSPDGDILRAVEVPDAGMAMLHATSEANGISQMRDVADLTLPPDVTVSLAPRGTHIMVMGLKHPLRAGNTLDAVLEFAHAGRVTVHVPVRPLGASGPAP